MKKAISLILALILALSCLVAISPVTAMAETKAATNLIVNGGFEDGLNGWKNYKYAAWVTIPAEVVNTEKNSGENSLNYYNRESASLGSRALGQQIELEPNTKYTLSFYLKGKPGWGKVVISGDMTGEIWQARDEVFKQQWSGDDFTEWTKHSYTFSTDDRTDYIFAIALTGTGTEAFLDDICIEKAPILYNGDFEEGFSGWRKVKWAAWASDAPAEVTTSEANSGTNSLYYNNPDGKSMPNRSVYQTVSLEANTIYELSFYAKGHLGWGKIRMTTNNVDPWNGAADDIFEKQLSDDNANWTKYTFNFETKEAKDYLLALTFTGAATNVYFDDFNIKKVGTIKFDGVSISAGKDITVKYYSAYGEGCTAKFTVKDKEFIAEGVFDEASKMYVYSINVTPDRMGDNIKAELIKDDVVIDVKETFTVKDYLEAIDDKSAADLGVSEAKLAALKVLANDMLHYGAAAQKYFGYKTDELVNADAGEGTVFVAPATTDKDVTNKEVNGVKITGQNLYFDNVNRLMFRFTVDPSVVEDIANVQFKITDGIDTTVIEAADFEKIGENEYVVYGDDIYATEFDTVFTATVVVNGEDTANVKYSVNSYVYAMCNKEGLSEDMLNLAKATYNYGLAAEAYAAE